MRTLKEYICEGLLRGEEATLIDGDVISFGDSALKIKLL